MYRRFQCAGIDPDNFKHAILDFSATSQKQLGLSGMNVGDIKFVNLFESGRLNPNALAFGRVYMKYHGNNQFSIVNPGATFDFSPFYDKDATLGRNLGNAAGAAINYNVYNPLFIPIPLIFGGGYDVNFNGTTTIAR